MGIKSFPGICQSLCVFHWYMLQHRLKLNNTIMSRTVFMNYFFVPNDDDSNIVVSMPLMNFRPLTFLSFYYVPPWLFDNVNVAYYCLFVSCIIWVKFDTTHLYFVIGYHLVKIELFSFGLFSSFVISFSKDTYIRPHDGRFFKIAFDLFEYNLMVIEFLAWWIGVMRPNFYSQTLFVWIHPS